MDVTCASNVLPISRCTVPSWFIFFIAQISPSCAFVLYLYLWSNLAMTWLSIGGCTHMHFYLCWTVCASHILFWHSTFSNFKNFPKIPTKKCHPFWVFSGCLGPQCVSFGPFFPALLPVLALVHRECVGLCADVMQWLDRQCQVSEMCKEVKNACPVDRTYWYLPISIDGAFWSPINRACHSPIGRAFQPSIHGWLPTSHPWKISKNLPISHWWNLLISHQWNLSISHQWSLPISHQWKLPILHQWNFPTSQHP